MTDTRAPLEPLRCEACGGAVPLADGATSRCPYCDAPVEIPAAYGRLAEAHATEVDTRRELEQRFRTVSEPPPRSTDVLAIALVLLLPPVLGVAEVLLAGAAADTVLVFATAVVPALLPGTCLWVWSASVHATIVRFQLALAGSPPEREGGPPRCRSCGAPLDVEPDAFAARCAYCGTDSLLSNLEGAARRLHDRLRGELHTLGEAAAALRTRRRLLFGGTITAAVMLGALAFAAVAAAAVLASPG